MNGEKTQGNEQAHLDTLEPKIELLDIWEITVAWITSQVAVPTQMNSVTLLMRRSRTIPQAHEKVFGRMKATPLWNQYIYGYI